MRKKYLKQQLKLSMELNELKDEKIEILIKKLNAICLEQSIDAMDRLGKEVHNNMGSFYSFPKNHCEKEDSFCTKKSPSDSMLAKMLFPEKEVVEVATTSKDEKEVVDAPTNFSEIEEYDSNRYYGEEPVLVTFKGEKRFAIQTNNEPSRFMPNVKFRITDNVDMQALHLPYISEKDCCFYTDENGDYLYKSSKGAFSHFSLHEVSYLEAIPELVPDGMVYDKESDSLIPLTEADKDNYHEIFDEKNGTVYKFTARSGCNLLGIEYPYIFGYVVNKTKDLIACQWDLLGNMLTEHNIYPVSNYNLKLIPDGMYHSTESRCLVEKPYNGHFDCLEDETAFINSEIAKDPEKFLTILNRDFGSPEVYAKLSNQLRTKIKI